MEVGWPVQSAASLAALSYWHEVWLACHVGRKSGWSPYYQKVSLSGLIGSKSDLDIGCTINRKSIAGLSYWHKIWPTLSYGQNIWPALSYGQKVWPTLSYGQKVWPALSNWQKSWPDLSYWQRVWPALSYRQRVWPALSYWQRVWPALSYWQRVWPALSYCQTVWPALSYWQNPDDLVLCMQYGQLFLSADSLGGPPVY